MGNGQRRGMPGNRGQFAPRQAGKTIPTAGTAMPSPCPPLPDAPNGLSIDEVFTRYREHLPAQPDTSQTPQVAITGADKRTWHVTPGTLDDAAREVLRSGQCHALARAVSERTGWPMVAAIDQECSYNSGIGHADITVAGQAICSCQFNHVLVEGPDGRLLDADGWHTTDDLDENLSFMPQAYLRGNANANTVIDRLVDRGEMREPADDVAATFVTALLDRYAQPPGHGPAR